MSGNNQDILSGAGIPMHVRWYANKCAQHRITCSSYAGWDIFTRPIKLSDEYKSPNKKVLSTSDIYLAGEGDDAFSAYDTIASESRIYVMSGFLSGVPRMIAAPYISIRNFIAVDHDLQLRASTFAVCMLCAMSLRTGYDMPPDVYVLMDNPQGLQPPYTQLSGPIYRKNTVYTREETGYNKWHLMAMGLLSEHDAQEYVNQEAMANSMQIEAMAHLKTIPSPQAYEYPADSPNLSYMDYGWLLERRTPVEICIALRKPFLHYYPNLVIPADKYYMREMVEATLTGIEEADA